MMITDARLCSRVREGGWKVHGVSDFCSPLFSCIKVRLRLVARRLLKSLSIKQGMKYDSPESTRNIQAFIDFHNLNVDEFLDPLDSFGAWWFSF